MPAKSSLTKSSRSRFRARTKRAPAFAVCASSAHGAARSPRGLRVKPCSGMNAIVRTPHAIVIAPPAITDARSETVLSATSPPSPSSEPTKPSRAPRSRAGPRFSTPISSASHAWYAPLVNVYEKPHSPQSTIAAKALVVKPTSAEHKPMPRKPAASDARRLYVSATTPVGTSNRKTAASITVPISTSCRGDMCRSRTR